ncbi:MAG: hypothetical protein JJT82_00290 [Legionellaceae bacterium]|nr:hypothetical protein [Legionellaceae bacterium]
MVHSAKYIRTLMNEIKTGHYKSALEEANKLQEDTPFTPDDQHMLLGHLVQAITTAQGDPEKWEERSLIFQLSATLLEKNKSLRDAFQQLPEQQARFLAADFMIYRKDEFFKTMTTVLYPEKQMSVLQLLDNTQWLRIVKAYKASKDSDDLRKFCKYMIDAHQPSFRQALLRSAAAHFHFLFDILKRSLYFYIEVTVHCFLALGVLAAGASLLTAALLLPAAFLVLLPYAAAASVAATMLVIPFFFAVLFSTTAVLTPLLLLQGIMPALFVAFGIMQATKSLSESHQQNNEAYNTVLEQLDNAMDQEGMWSDTPETALPDLSFFQSARDVVFSYATHTPQVSQSSRPLVQRLGLFAQETATSDPEAPAAAQQLVGNHL